VFLLDKVIPYSVRFLLIEGTGAAGIAFCLVKKTFSAIFLFLLNYYLKYISMQKWQAADADYQSGIAEKEC